MTDGGQYLIWSNEHRAWWGPGGRGYFRNSGNAGRFTRAEALDICSNAMLGRRGGDPLPEIPVAAEDLEFMRQRFAGMAGDREPEALDQWSGVA